MIYLGNGLYSDSGYLSHGGPWKTHKYIAIQNGRYVYPDDKNPHKKKTWKDGLDIKVPGVPNLNTSRLPDKRENGPTLNTNPAKPADFYKLQREKKIDRDNSHGPSNPKKLKKKPEPKPVTKPSKPRKGNIDRYNKTVTTQGPSAAEMAQRGSSNTKTSIPGTSRNTGAGSKNVKYTQYKPGAITKGTKWSTVDTKSKTKEYQDYYSRSAQEAGRAPTKKKKKKLKDYLFGKKGDTYSTTKTSNGNTIYKKIK